MYLQCIFCAPTLPPIIVLHSLRSWIRGRYQQSSSCRLGPVSIEEIKVNGFHSLLQESGVSDRQHPRQLWRWDCGGKAGSLHWPPENPRSICTVSIYIQIAHTHTYPRSQRITANQHIGYLKNYLFGSPPPPPPLHLSSTHLLDLLQPLLCQLLHLLQPQLHLPQPLEERWRGGGDPNK